jgi:putative Holliday junction resolvase
VSERGGRVLALDLGEVRIGLALSDSLGITAQPLGFLKRVGPKKDLAAIAELIDRHDVKTVVVGLPRLLSGEEGSKAAEAREVAERLARRLPRVAVELWDERLTTVEAERTLVAGNVRRRRRRERVDSLAAALILQGYLEARSLRGEEGGE